MAVRKILTVPKDEKALRKKSKKVEKINALTYQLIDDMLETIEGIGYGLAAPQVGVLKRIIVVRHEDKVYKLINPRLTEKSEDIVCGVEGCLSMPDKIGDVERHMKVTVKAQDISGKNIKISAENLLARIFQHEIDHLNGILYIDKAKNLRKPETEEAAEDTEI